jgi:hypothetical protein
MPVRSTDTAMARHSVLVKWTSTLSLQNHHHLQTRSNDASCSKLEKYDVQPFYNHAQLQYVPH